MVSAPNYVIDDGIPKMFEDVRSDAAIIQMLEGDNPSKKKKKRVEYPTGTVYVHGKPIIPGQIIQRAKPDGGYAEGEIIPRKSENRKIVKISEAVPDVKKVMQTMADNIGREKELKHLTKELYELYAKRSHIAEVLKKINYKKRKSVGVGAELNYKLNNINERIIEIESKIGPKRYYKTGKIKRFFVSAKNAIKKTFKKISKRISDDTLDAIGNVVKIFVPVMVPLFISKMLKPA